MEIEKLTAILVNAKNVEIKNLKEFGQLTDSLEFNREIFFSVDDQEYSIVWFKNSVTLRSGNLSVMADTVELRGTWPNGKKMNLQFYYGSDVVAVIGVEDY